METEESIQSANDATENPDNSESPEKPEKLKTKFVARSATDMQRIKLEKLMEHPEKQMIIPQASREKKYLSAIPTFVRNVMGSSAGAGSGEFHVYRHLRRKEYARQKYIQHQSRQEELDVEYQMKIETNRLEAEAKTAKKRAKRQKKKLNKKTKKSEPKSSVNQCKNDDGEDEDVSESDKEHSDEELKSTTEDDGKVECNKNTDKDEIDGKTENVMEKLPIEKQETEELMNENQITVKEDSKQLSDEKEM